MPVSTRVIGSSLEYLDDNGNLIFAVDGAQRKLIISPSATLDLAAGEIVAADLATGAVTTAKIAASAVTAAEIATDAVTAAKIAASAVTTAKINAAAVTNTKLAGGFLKVALAAGTAAATDVTVAAIAAGDELVSVLSFVTAAAIATVANRTAEYTIQSGGLDKVAGTDETNNQLLIIYLDLT